MESYELNLHVVSCDVHVNYIRLSIHSSISVSGFFFRQGSLFTERWTIAGGSKKGVQKRKVTGKERCLENKCVQKKGRERKVSGKKRCPEKKGGRKRNWTCMLFIAM